LVGTAHNLFDTPATPATSPLAAPSGRKALDNSKKRLRLPLVLVVVLRP
jgi:hypothetical protein